MHRVMVVLAVIWATGCGLYFAFGPVYAGSSVRATILPDSSDPSKVVEIPSPRREYTTSGLKVNGAPLLLLVLGIPVVLAAAPLFVRRELRRRAAGAAAVLTLAFAVVGAMSVGLLYIPSAVALGVAAAWPSRRSHPTLGPNAG